MIFLLEFSARLVLGQVTCFVRKQKWLSSLSRWWFQPNWINNRETDDLCRPLYSPPRFNSSPLEIGLKWRPKRKLEKVFQTSWNFRGYCCCWTFGAVAVFMLPSRFNCSQRGNDDRTYQSCIAQSWQIAFQEEEGGLVRQTTKSQRTWFW